MKVKCIKQYVTNDYDTNEEIEVENGTIWEVCESDYRIIDGEVRLENDDMVWLEMPKEEFEEYFKITHKVIE